ncbi:hypothetical protein CLOLEP_01344 [[Clostridium] leptum DSM 753]|uniref:Uncharacterized protein n=1 Tax=[Clostridium] leptum DSM 753 TaxID=428125 RepID=A7VS07_9FIRM|nr:hypothetical protein CLOLEP_01344 [[Clostridium] leptum DSM 753]
MPVLVVIEHTSTGGFQPVKRRPLRGEKEKAVNRFFDFPAQKSS